MEGRVGWRAVGWAKSPGEIKFAGKQIRREFFKTSFNHFTGTDFAVCLLRAHRACLLCACCVHAACMLRACCVLDSFILGACCVLTACLLSACCMLAACLLRACCVLAAFLVRAWLLVACVWYLLVVCLIHYLNFPQNFGSTRGSPLYAYRSSPCSCVYSQIW